jgi:predicted CoA-binding protein
MRENPRPIQEFLSGKRIAVAGVSRNPHQAANAIFRRLKSTGHETVPVNPRAVEVEGERCYPSLHSAPQPLDGVVIATHPSAAARVARECAELGIKRVWFHRSFGQGSVSREALDQCAAAGIEAIEGGCPMMYCGSVDVPHRCFRFLLRLRHRVPG